MAIILTKPPLEESWKYCYITDVRIISILEKTSIHMEYKYYAQCYFKRTEAFRYALRRLTGVDPGCYLDEISVEDFDEFSMASRNKYERRRKFGLKLVSKHKILLAASEIEDLMNGDPLVIEGGEINGRRALNSGTTSNGS